jgi:hypothetical protein
MRKADNRLLQRWTRRSRLLLLVLLPPWILSLAWSFCTVAPAVAKTKSRGAPTRHAPPKKAPPAPVLSYEKRLQKALELTQQNKWPQAIEIIGTLESAAPATPTIGRLWFLRAMLAQKLQDTPTAVHAFGHACRVHRALATRAQSVSETGRRGYPSSTPGRRSHDFTGDQAAFSQGPPSQGGAVSAVDCPFPPETARQSCATLNASPAPTVTPGVDH